MKPIHIAVTLSLLMCSASMAGFVLRPGSKAAAKGHSMQLETLVPKTFGNWTLEPERGTQVINPQTKELLDKLYSQMLSRTYVNKDGYRVMLSLAYGDDQRGGLQAHRPEVCYPAQGFALTSQPKDGALKTAFGDIAVRRLSTQMGPRSEPVTYWLTLGDQVIQSSFDKRIAEIRLGLTGQIPDGLLFRVSSIDKNTENAHAMQQKFTADMMAAVPPAARKQLGGLSIPATTN
jgi:EpsI family protein